MATDSPQPDSHLLSCDWGTSHFRLRLVETSTGATVREVFSDDGVARLAAQTAPHQREAKFRQTLAQRVDELAALTECDLHKLPVFISGMASSSIGWRELPYASLPFSIDGQGLCWQLLEPLSAGGGSVVLVSGVRGPQDVMRGEETEIVGLSRLPFGEMLQREATVILPGTHSKHVHLRDGHAVDFQTYMTGELFELLRQHSSLRHSTQPTTGKSGATPADEVALDKSFCAGVRQAAEHALSASLFQVRVRQLLEGVDPPANTAYLSGLLIGAELRMLRNASMPLVLCAGAALTQPYQRAFQTLDLAARLTVVPPSDVDSLSTSGHLHLERRHRQENSLRGG